MSDTEENKRICIIDNLLDCQQPHQHIHLKEEKKSIIANNSKVFFSEKKLQLTENKKIKSLNCFRHQIDIIVKILSCETNVQLQN